jgi:hypothetical protein
MFPRRNQPETAQRETASTASHSGYMAELEQWLDEEVFEPIERAIETNDVKELHLAFSESKQLLKKKVLASYHNGLKAKPTSNPKNNGQQTYRRN